MCLFPLKMTSSHQALISGTLHTTSRGGSQLALKGRRDCHLEPVPYSCCCAPGQCCCMGGRASIPQARVWAPLAVKGDTALVPEGQLHGKSVRLNVSLGSPKLHHGRACHPGVPAVVSALAGVHTNSNKIWNLRGIL